MVHTEQPVDPGPESHLAPRDTDDSLGSLCRVPVLRAPDTGILPSRTP